MAQISRPFQVALAAVALLALVWVVALHRSGGSSESTSGSHAAAVASTPAKTASGPAAAGQSSGSGAGVYHGSAPGVEGLTRAIAKAHGAVATSQQNAKQLAEKSEQASSAGAPSSTGAASGASATPSSTGAASGASATPSSAAPSSTHATGAPARTTSASAPAATRKATPKLAPHRLDHIPVLARQRLVEAELKQGKVVALLFWSSKGSDDVAVRNALSQLSGKDHRLVVHIAAASQVASFGSITRGVQVYGTPTILLVGRHGRTIVLTGLQDAYAIQQAVAEARHA